MSYIQLKCKIVISKNVQLSFKKNMIRNTPIYFNTSYCTEMKLVPNNRDYCLLQFDALKFVLEVCLHGGLYLTLFFSM